MKNLVIEPHYLGSLEYFALLMSVEEVVFEIHDTFPKQTFRNRAYFLSSNRTQPLMIPIKYSNNSRTEEVTIDYTQRWIKDHWGALYSGYGKAPFFEYFAEEIKAVWEDKAERLIDLNLNFLKLMLRILQKDLKISFTKEFQKECPQDFRNVINPKKDFSNRKIYEPVPYPQLFGDTFVPNLSIVDLIMCEGPNAAQILTQSYPKRIDS